MSVYRMKISAETIRTIEKGASELVDALSSRALAEQAGTALSEAATKMAPGAFRAEAKLAVGSNGKSLDFTAEEIAKLLGRGPIEVVPKIKETRGIPELASNGYLPPGIHVATWSEFTSRFANTEHRQELAKGLLGAANDLKNYGHNDVFVGGSYVSRKVPNDFDLTFSSPRNSSRRLLSELPIFRDEELTKRAYGGHVIENAVDYFLRNRKREYVGLVKLDMNSLPQQVPNVSMGSEFITKYGGVERFRRALPIRSESDDSLFLKAMNGEDIHKPNPALQRIFDDLDRAHK